MKKIYLGLLCGAIAISAAAQQSFNVVTEDATYSFPATEEQMRILDGSSIIVEGVAFNFSNVIRMEVVDYEIDPNTVIVEYSGESADVTVAGNVAQYVSASVSGAHVTLNQSDEVSADTSGEITYILKGESDNGSFLFNGSFKSTIELQGLTLTNPSGGAIDIENGKRIDFSSKNGTVNTITDGAKGAQKAAIYCKGHLELKGKGELNVTGNTAHAISAKEYIEMKNCTLNILGSVKDGINCNQYFLLESGELNISKPGDDGIQVSYKDDADREAEDTGSITINGGSLTIDEITATAAKGMKAEGDLFITGGDIKINTSAPGEWDSSKSKTKASACIGIDGNIEISGGSLDLYASGGGGKGISCDEDFAFKEGELKIVTAGGVLAYVNGSLNQNYTGSTDRLDSDYKSSPKGVKVDGNIEIKGGSIFVTTSGNGGEGIESKAVLTISGGNVKVRAKDDAINSSSTMYIKGGVVDVISTGNDGLDSNGDMWIEGGIVMAFGAGGVECGIDVNHEGGYRLYFTGGNILGAGGGNSLPSNSSSTQPYVSLSVALEANTQVTVGNASETLYTFTTPSDLTNVSLGGGFGGGRPGGMGNGSGSGVVISVPGMTEGTSYTVKCGDSSASATAQTYSTGGGMGPGGR